MKKQLISFSIIMMSLILTGCGQEKLSDEQKQRVQKTFNSIGTLHSSVSKVDQRINGSNHSNTVKNKMIGKLFGANQLDRAQQDAIDKLSDELEKSVVSGDCKIEMKIPDFEKVGSAFDLEMKMQVTGASCPIYMNLSFNMENKSKDQTSLDFSGDFIWNFEIKDESYNELIDISKLNLAGNFKMKADENSGSGSIKINGDIFSQKEGDIKMQISGKFNAQGESISGSSDPNGELKVKIDYPDFSCELKTKMQSDGNITYFINGDEVSAEEFQNFIDGLAIN